MIYLYLHTYVHVSACVSGSCPLGRDTRCQLGATTPKAAPGSTLYLSIYLIYIIFLYIHTYIYIHIIYLSIYTHIIYLYLHTSIYILSIYLSIHTFSIHTYIHLSICQGAVLSAETRVTNYALPHPRPRQVDPRSIYLSTQYLSIHTYICPSQGAVLSAETRATPKASPGLTLDLSIYLSIYTVSIYTYIHLYTCQGAVLSAETRVANYALPHPRPRQGSPSIYLSIYTFSVYLSGSCPVGRDSGRQLRSTTSKAAPAARARPRQALPLRRAARWRARSERRRCRRRL